MPIELEISDRVGTCMSCNRGYETPATIKRDKDGKYVCQHMKNCPTAKNLYETFEPFIREIKFAKN